MDIYFDSSFFYSILIFFLCLVIPFIGIVTILKNIITMIHYAITFLIRLSFVIHLCVNYFMKMIFAVIYGFTKEKGGDWWAEFNEGLLDLYNLTDSFILSDITKQEEEKLMVVPVNSKEFEYVISDEKNLDQEKKTIWKLTPIPARDMYKIRDRLIEGRGNLASRTEIIKMGTFEYDTIRRGITGWENFGDVKFKKDKNGFVIDDQIDMIPSDVRIELFAAIQNGPDYDHKKTNEDIENQSISGDSLETEKDKG